MSGPFLFGGVMAGEINRELNEALARYDNHEPIDPDTLDVYVEAARWTASFPTDEDVAIAQKAMLGFGPMASMQGMRAALEAVAPNTNQSQSKSELVVEAVALDPKEGP
jgi:hypothetical protein